MDLDYECIILDTFDEPFVVTDEDGNVQYFENKEIAEAYAKGNLQSWVVVELPD
jgi:hypothetical protein